MTDSDWIERIIEWSNANPKFDMTFILSLQEAIEEYDELTCSQHRALHNIIEKFRIKPSKN